MGDGAVGREGNGDPLALSEVTTRAEFGQLLTALRVRSEKSLRELAAAVEGSPSTLSGWCRAENLPFPAQYEAFRALLRALGVVDIEPWMDALVRVRDGGAGPNAGGPPPYRGLQSFTQADADWFYGRAELLQHTRARLREVATGGQERLRLLVVVGASGSGKSSLLHAGLCHDLVREGTACLSLTPGADPVQRLAGCLAAHDPADTARVLDLLRTDPGGWLADRQTKGADDDLVVVVDQFEELFTACADEAERSRFLTVLETIAAPGGRCVVVASLRIDFYADLVASGHLVPSLQDAQILVGPMDTAQLTKAIVEPAKRAGWSVDDDLVALLLRDFVPSGSIGGQHDAGALPLLSHALLETWNCARRGRLTVADYHAAGGIRGAVEQSAERVFAQLPDRDRALVRQIFLRLVRVGDDAVATRRAARYSELDGLAGAGDAAPDGNGAPRASVTDLLDRFVAARLLTAHESTIEITHESLLAAWPRLRAWIDEDRDGLRAHRRIAEAARTWMDSGRDPSALAGGTRLETMRSWADSESSTLPLTQAEKDFLAASAEREATAAAATRRGAIRLRALAAVAVVFALLAGSMAVATTRARSEAITARDRALSRQIALTAERLRGSDRSLAAQLAVAGYRVAPTSEARSQLLDSAVFPPATRYLGGPGPAALALAGDGSFTAVSNAVDGTVQVFVPSADGRSRAGVLAPVGQDLEIYAMALSPDDRILAVGDTSPAITLWEVSDPAAPRQLGEPLQGPTGPIQGLDIDPSGTELAAVGLGDGVFRWDISDPSRPRELAVLESPVITWSVAYSPDGTHLAHGDDTGQVHVWDTSTGEGRPVSEVTVGEREVATVAFSPDGRTLAAGSRDGQLGVWDLASPSEPAPLDVAEAEFDSWVNTTAFSPDGDQLLAGSSDTDLRVWDTAGWTLGQTLPHPAALTAAAFAGGDGDSIASVAMDGVLRLWDGAAAPPPQLAGSVWNLGFSADGERMAAFSGPESGLWELTDPTAPQPLMDPLAAPDADMPFAGSGALSPDGTLLAHGTAAGAVVVFDVSDPDAPTELGKPLGGASQLVEAVAFSPDGTLMAAGGGEGEIRVWDVTDPERPRLESVIEGPTEMVLNLAWHPGGRHLAVPSADSTVYLFDVTEPDEPRQVARLDGFDSEAYTAAFSPDGNLLATAGSDTTVVLWDVEDPDEPRRIGQPITGPLSRIFTLSVHPSGDSLAAAVGDGTVWVWDISNPQHPERTAVLGPAEGQMYTAGFAPAGDVLVAGGADARLRLWPTDEQAVIDHICATAGDRITEEEWTTYVAGRVYDPPCDDLSG